MTVISTINLITKWLAVGTWLVYSLWQLVLVILRLSGVNVKLISMVEKDLGYGGLAALVYFWSGMATHWWMTWRQPVWSSPIPGIMFWVIGAVYLATDLIWPTPHGGDSPLLILRYPSTVWVIGSFCGWFLFPQGKPNWNPF